MKKCLFVLGFLAAVSAQAKTYFDEATGKALTYYRQGDNVNASVCENVSEQELRSSLKDVLKTKCSPLSENGITKADIDKKLPELKTQMLAAIGAVGGMMSGMGGMTKDQDIQNMMSGMMSGIFDQQKKAIENLTADQVFQQYLIEAQVPTLEKVKKSEDLDSEIEQFAFLATK